MTYFPKILHYMFVTGLPSLRTVLIDDGMN